MNKLVLMSDGNLLLHRDQASTLISNVSLLFFYSQDNSYLGLIQVDTLRNSKPNFASIAAIWNVAEIEQDTTTNGEKALKVILPSKGLELPREVHNVPREGHKCKKQELIMEILESLIRYVIVELDMQDRRDEREYFKDLLNRLKEVKDNESYLEGPNKV